jgi:translation initiation factor 3 subunit B
LTALTLRPSELCFLSALVLLSNFLSRYQVQYDDSFDKTLVVDGVPIIDNSKLERLLTKISKEFSRKGVSIKPDDIFMPWDNASGKSKG